MTWFTRGALLVVAIACSMLAVAVGLAAWMGGTWTAGNPDTLSLRIALEGTPAARSVVVIVAAAVAALVLIPGVIAVFMAPRSITLWLNEQQPVRVPARVIERTLRTAIQGVKDVESVNVTTRSARSRTTAVQVDLMVSPDADVSVVTASVEDRVAAVLKSASSIVLERRPSITIRHVAQRGSAGNQRPA
ncbi:MAG: hypothetical protein WC273_10245 [Dehalococcoidia bacterium]